MKSFSDIKMVYFLGIGGIGMSALARYFKHAGVAVAGYDRTETALTQALVAEGIAVHYTDQPEWLAANLNPANTLVVLTPAVPAELQERVFVEENGFVIKKRSAVLGLICDEGRTIGVAGTHGKTTVSTMVAHLLKSSSQDCNAFLGGISKNYQTNLLLAADSQWMVAEADEFDRSFLQLHPELAVITSMDADHLDIYGDHSAIQDSFRAYARQVSGALLCKKGLPLTAAETSASRYFTYAVGEEADFYAANVQLLDEAYCFDLIHPNGVLKNIRLNYPGLLNVENMTAASAIALLAGLTDDEIRTAVASYQGVKRRFDIRYRSDKFIVIDDYAHHPAELKATIASVKAMFAGRKLTGLFQPHLYSRTRDFAADFARELSELDELFLLDIYPAREKPIPGVSSSIIFDEVSAVQKRLVSRNSLAEQLNELEPGVILMMGAGDIDTLVEPVVEHLKARAHVE